MFYHMSFICDIFHLVTIDNSKVELKLLEVQMWALRVKSQPIIHQKLQMLLKKIRIRMVDTLEAVADPTVILKTVNMLVALDNQVVEADLKYVEEAACKPWMFMWSYFRYSK